MKIIDVTDEQGRRLKVDASTQKVYAYNNKKALIEYNAEIVENGIRTGFWTNYVASGKLEDIEDRVKVWNGVVKSAYAASVNFNASKYDPDGKIETGLIEYIRNHEEEFFDEYGDWKSDLIINNNVIKEMVKVMEE